jgi:hypothetical protein
MVSSFLKDMEYGLINSHFQSPMACRYETCCLDKLTNYGGWSYCQRMGDDRAWGSSSILSFIGSEPVFANLLRSPRIDSQPGGPVRQPYLSYRPAKLHRLAESTPGLLKRLKIRALANGTNVFCFLSSLPLFPLATTPVSVSHLPSLY